MVQKFPRKNCKRNETRYCSKRNVSVQFWSRHVYQMVYGLIFILTAFYFLMDACEVVVGLVYQRRGDAPVFLNATPALVVKLATPMKEWSMISPYTVSRLSREEHERPTDRERWFCLRSELTNWAWASYTRGWGFCAPTWVRTRFPHVEHER